MTHAVTIGLRFGRRRGDLGDGQVAVHGEREGARDRRRGHVEDVRAAALRERGALLDAEAVLLVDDRDGEVAEADLLLDQRVRADDDLHVARGDQLADVRGSFAVSALVRSATRTPSSAQMPSIVRKCCSASVSVGAISAPCRPASTARSSA